MSEPKEGEWEDKGMCGDYYERRHKPCGAVVLVLGGYRLVCPNCQPEEWAKAAGREE
jgi:hypothetical protein